MDACERFEQLAAKCFDRALIEPQTTNALLLADIANRYRELAAHCGKYDRRVKDTARRALEDLDEINCAAAH